MVNLLTPDVLSRKPTLLRVIVYTLLSITLKLITFPTETGGISPIVPRSNVTLPDTILRTFPSRIPIIIRLLAPSAVSRIRVTEVVLRGPPLTEVKILPYEQLNEVLTIVLIRLNGTGLILEYSPTSLL